MGKEHLDFTNIRVFQQNVVKVGKMPLNERSVIGHDQRNKLPSALLAGLAGSLTLFLCPRPKKIIDISWDEPILYPIIDQI